MDVRGIDNLRTQAQQYDAPAREEVAISASEELRESTGSVAKKDEDKGGDQPLNEEEQQRRMTRLQDTLKSHNIEISYNEDVNRYAIKILDAESKEVVKEIPSEKTLEMFARMLEIEGLLMDEKR